MMIDDRTRQHVRSLLDALRERPTELPLAEVTRLAGRGVRVSIDREGPEPVVFVVPGPDRRFERLTAREYEVATLVAAGFSNRHIAAALFISLGTVKDHVHAILAKTGLASRSEVVAAWYRAP
jgi:DNA-binding NarL/FixJ family response regulator